MIATAADIEAIERATLAAVAPQAIDEMPGWLLPFDGGTIGRAKSAVPLCHAASVECSGDGWPVAEGDIQAIERRYAARGLSVALRLPDAPGFDRFKLNLARLGYQAGRPTQVQIADTAAVLQVTEQPHADLADAPDPAWAALFLGEGFDPVDGASRVANLSRAQGTRYASLREGACTLAAGAGAFSHGWASVHGMRTEQAQRGRGLASRVLAAVAHEALARGIGRMFLQVEEGNAPALALYRRAGFETAWRYEYWSKE